GPALALTDLAQEVLGPRPLPGPPGPLEAVAHPVHAPGRLQGQGLVLGVRRVAHGRTSPSQTLRISRSLRSTVRTDSPSFPATSPLVHQSVFQTAREQSRGSPSAASGRRYSSAAAAANCWSGSWAISSANRGPSPDPERLWTRPPPRFSRRQCRTRSVA